jgi:hypothetical protein
MNDFAKQINDAHQEVLKATKTKLEAAIKAGEVLILAKENVKAARPRTKWADWLKDNCPTISQRTANVYKQLAEKKPLVLRNWQHRCQTESLSLRNVLASIPKSAEKVAEAQQRKAEREVKKAEEEAAKTRTLLMGIPVNELFTVVREWGDAKVKALADLIYGHLNAKAAPAPPTPAPTPQPQSDQPMRRQ